MNRDQAKQFIADKYSVQMPYIEQVPKGMAFRDLAEAFITHLTTSPSPTPQQPTSTGDVEAAFREGFAAGQDAGMAIGRGDSRWETDDEAWTSSDALARIQQGGQHG